MPKKTKKPQAKTKRTFGIYSLSIGGDNDRAALYMYGDIGDDWWDETSTSALGVIEALADIDAPEIDVYINSYGGSVKEGLAIFNALVRHDATINVCIDGIAASMASYIAMAGNTVNMAENAMMMIHAPWGGAVGNAKEMREAADVLDLHADVMSKAYVRGDFTLEDAQAALSGDKDYWYSADQALDAGLVDEVTEPMKIAAGLRPDRMKNLPAAAAAFIQPKEVKKMPNNVASKPAKQAAVDPKPETDAKKIAAQALADDKSRRDDIGAVFKPFASTSGMTELMMSCQNDTACTVENAREQAMTKLGEGAVAVGGAPRVQSGESESEKLITGAGVALAVRAGLLARDDKDADLTGNEFRSYSLREMARAFLVRNSVNTGMMGPRELVGAAFGHSTSDFGNLLANIAQKAMLKGYDEAEETFQAWTTRGELPDFKAASRVDLNSFPSLKAKAEGAEYKSATVGDRGEMIELATYGATFAITREAVINDDLNSFTRIPMKMGRAAIRTVGDLVYAVLTSNPNMADGTALFHASRNNLITGAALTTAFVDSMRVAMATQKEGEANLNIRLANLIVPVALEGSANVVADAEYEVKASSKDTNQRIPNSVRGTFGVVSDARLDSDSATDFFAVANSAQHDTIEVAYLDGQDTPYLDQKESWSTDGSEFKVRIDAGVKALDSKTIQKAEA